MILEALSGGFSTEWAWVQPEIARVTRVCSYDRAGRPWSDAHIPGDLWETAENLHTLLGNAGCLRRPAKIASNAEVKDEILDREEEVPESRFYSCPCVVCRTGPPAQGRLHAYQNVLNRSFGFRIWEEDVALSLRERLHPLFKLSVRSMEASVDLCMSRARLRSRGLIKH